MNRKAFDRINYGLFIVSAAAEGKLHGCVVNSLHQVTSSMPPKFSLTVNKSNETFKAIESAGSFCATVLAQSAPKELINQFGYKSGRVTNKFDGLDIGTDAAGNPYIKEHMLARISCKITEKLDLGSYMLYIATATEAEIMGEGTALTVDYFKNGGGTTPVTATVYRTLEKEEGWKCSVCGYIAEKETLPDGYRCPLCKAGKDKFVKL